MILGTLDLSEEAYRRWFRRLCYKFGTPPHTLSQQMKASAIRWLQPAVRNTDQVVELVVTEQLITTLPTDIKS